MKFVKGMSSQDYIEKVRENFKNNDIFENILRKSNFETMKTVKEANRDFVVASVKYLDSASAKVRRGYRPQQGNPFEIESEEKKALNKSFNCRTKEKQNIFNPNTYNNVKGYNLFIYNLMDADFDAQLLVEPNLQSNFEVMVDLYNSFIEVRKGCYLGHYENVVLFVNTNNGKIYRIGDRDMLKFFKAGVTGFEKCGNIYCVVTKEWSIGPIIENGELVEGIWLEAAQQNTPKKPYNIIVFRNRKDGQKGIKIYNHVILLLAKYGIDAIKFLLSKGGMVSCDHKDENKTNNDSSNLDLICRPDNVSRAREKDDEKRQILYEYNLNNYFEYIDNSFKGTTEKEREERQNARDMFWNVVFQGSKAKDIILAA